MRTDHRLVTTDALRCAHAVSQTKVQTEKIAEKSVSKKRRKAQLLQRKSLIYLLAVLLLQGMLQVGSRHFIGRRLPHSNSTQITDGCSVDQLLCFRCIQTIAADTVINYVTQRRQDQYYHYIQRQTGTEQSDVAACAICKFVVIPKSIRIESNLRYRLCCAIIGYISSTVIGRQYVQSNLPKESIAAARCTMLLYNGTAANNEAKLLLCK